MTTSFDSTAPDHSTRVRELVEGCRAVVFDLDDTLLATREVKWAHHKAVAAQFYDIELTDDELRLHWGKPFDEMITLLYRGSAPLAEMRAANHALDADYRKTALPGAVATVAALLDRGYRIGVVTSANTGPALSELEANGFPVRRLLFVHGADATSAHKPDPAVFEHGMELLAPLDIDERATIYVGDALMDLLAARGAGMGFVGVTTGLVTGTEFDGENACWIPNLAALTR
ncbi:HAD family hydrolase [Amycolatopsis sp. CA-230715]|uniref:HAD family hydrolase n=1 Tax=Amycolatopsis sp. CA-230715 TaxID=2745196 RepID=UPI001C00F1EB|nr:HAD hydrolase-like protein [Amycolatopsis sp. CA-230715]QWF82150.1 Phosphoglycolate phosphatase [Amycolatopsis sp. CA-230715]